MPGIPDDEANLALFALMRDIGIEMGIRGPWAVPLETAASAEEPDSPTPSPSPKCFETNAELRAAVTAYIDGGEAGAAARSVYGEAIGDWWYVPNLGNTDSWKLILTMRAALSS